MMTRINRIRRKLIDRGGRAGFSLVEIMMVMVILSVGILPLAVIHHQARREVTESDQYTQAMTVAQAEMERIKGLGFGNAAADTGQEGIITWTCAVNNVSFGMDRIEVTATWQSHDGPQVLSVADLVSIR